MQLSNAKRIITEDFKQDQRDSVGKLAEILNPFMEEVVELSNKNIGIDNLNRSIVKIDIIVDANGKPQGVSKINTTLPSYSGKNIIDVISLSGGEAVTSAPYLSCSYLGNGLVQINKFIGLTPGKKLRVVIEFYG